MIKSTIFLGVFRTQSNIYDGTILRKAVTIFAKGSIADVPLDFKYTSEFKNIL